MSPSRQEELFERALSLPPADRSAWLARACADDASLRAQLESLLSAHEEAPEFMEAPLADLAPTKPRFEVLAEEKAGDRIGRYKLLQQIGEGGCGVVYMAEQEEAVRRRVALKVIKLGMDTKAVIARFEAERQALARMEHPNIARVLDAGATRSGRPFFVMELVRGMRITNYCDQNNLSTAQRLHLFIKVCHAIQHAHQKGVIHRDIKPSNILVTLHDGEPVPKVIDFGIAKATQGRLTEQTLFTAFEQFIGTPAYVSPEQAEMSGLDIDTRSDIYSLGVLLYELLAGRTPFDTNELVDSGIDEMRRRIREQEPPRPSHRLRTLTDSDRTTVALRRGTDAPRLSLQLRGDLDWIVMRCLEKDRSRRYETANGLAMDIQRHLDNEPVIARPPSTAYLLQKLMRRHRLAFGAGAAITLALAAGFAVSTVLFLRERATLERAREAEAKALSEKARAETARNEAEAGRKLVQEEVARRGKLVALMTSTLKDIGLHVSLPGGDRRVLRDMIEQSSKLKKEFADQPEIAAGIDETLSGIYFKLGDFKQAEDLLLESLKLRTATQGKNAPEVAQTLNDLGVVYSGQSRWIDAERCHRDALELLQDLHGAEHPEVARTLSTRGWVLAQQAKLSEAEHYLRLALGQQQRLGPPADAATTLGRLGSVLTQVGRVHDAEDVLRSALRINQQVFGRETLETASALNFLAVTVALTQERLPEAIQMYRDAFEIRERINNPNTLSLRMPAAPAENRIPTAPAVATLHAVLVEPRATGAVETMLTPRGILAQVEAALRDAQLYAVQQYGRDSWEEAFNHALRVWVMLQEQKFAEAEPVARQCLAIRQKLRPDDWSTHHALHLLGAVLAGQKRFTEAEPLLIAGYENVKARRTDIPPFHIPRIGESATRIITFYASLGRADKVAEWQAEFNGLDDEAKRVLLGAAQK